MPSRLATSVTLRWRLKWSICAGPRSSLRRGEVGEPHQLAARRGDGDVADGARIAAVAVLGAQPDVDLVLLLAEGADRLAADQRAQRAGDVAHLDAEDRRLLARDLDAQLGLAHRQGGVDVDEPARGAHLRP